MENNSPRETEEEKAGLGGQKSRYVKLSGKKY